MSTTTECLVAFKRQFILFCQFAVNELTQSKGDQGVEGGCGWRGSLTHNCIITYCIDDAFSLRQASSQAEQKRSGQIKLDQDESSNMLPLCYLSCYRLSR